MRAIGCGAPHPQVCWSRDSRGPSSPAALITEIRAQAQSGPPLHQDAIDYYDAVFPTAAHLVSWAECPQVAQSGGKRKGANASGRGNRYIGAALGEAAAGVGRTQSFPGARYRRPVVLVTQNVHDGDVRGGRVDSGIPGIWRRVGRKCPLVAGLDQSIQTGRATPPHIRPPSKQGASRERVKFGYPGDT
jgi:hypothetical protein